MIQRVHGQTLRAPLAEIAGSLQALLSRRVTAYIAGVKDTKTVGRWANGEITEIRALDVERRLRTAYAISQLLLEVDSARTVKAWFVSLNPYLADETPAEAIREGREKEAMAAARAFVATG